MWKWRYNVFDLSRDHTDDMSRDFVGGVPSSKVTNRFSLGSIGLVKIEISRFWFARHQVVDVSHQVVDVSRDYMGGVPLG